MPIPFGRNVSRHFARVPGISFDWMITMDIDTRMRDPDPNPKFILQALVRLVERDPSFWTFERRRRMCRRGAWPEQHGDGPFEAEKVFYRLLQWGQAPVLMPFGAIWDFLQKVEGIDIKTFRRMTVPRPSVRYDELHEGRGVPWCPWSSTIVVQFFWEWSLNVTQMGSSSKKRKLVVDFFTRWVELYSLEDIKAIREDSLCFKYRLGDFVQVTEDFLTMPLAKTIPWLVECRRLLGPSAHLTEWDLFDV